MQRQEQLGEVSGRAQVQLMLQTSPAAILAQVIMKARTILKSLKPIVKQ